jgi:hypothetical protein
MWPKAVHGPRINAQLPVIGHIAVQAACEWRIINSANINGSGFREAQCLYAGHFLEGGRDV